MIQDRKRCKKIADDGKKLPQPMNRQDALARHQGGHDCAGSYCLHKTKWVDNQIGPLLMVLAKIHSYLSMQVLLRVEAHLYPKFAKTKASIFFFGGSWLSATAKPVFCSSQVNFRALQTVKISPNYGEFPVKSRPSTSVSTGCWKCSWPNL